MADQTQLLELHERAMRDLTAERDMLNKHLEDMLKAADDAIDALFEGNTYVAARILDDFRMGIRAKIAKVRK